MSERRDLNCRCATDLDVANQDLPCPGSNVCGNECVRIHTRYWGRSVDELLDKIPFRPYTSHVVGMMKETADIVDVENFIQEVVE